MFLKRYNGGMKCIVVILTIYTQNIISLINYSIIVILSFACNGV